MPLFQNAYVIVNIICLFALLAFFIIGFYNVIQYDKEKHIKDYKKKWRSKL